MKVPRNAIVDVLELVLGRNGARQATKYLSPDMRVTATMTDKPDDWAATLVLTIGKPNYAQRKFIKVWRKAGQPFPIRSIQAKWWK